MTTITEAQASSLRSIQIGLRRMNEELNEILESMVPAEGAEHAHHRGTIQEKGLAGRKSMLEIMAEKRAKKR